jgi:hypothetical protein
MDDFPVRRWHDFPKNTVVSYSKGASATSQAIAQGKCITAQGTKDGGGTLQATVVALGPPTTANARSLPLSNNRTNDRPTDRPIRSHQAEGVLRDVVEDHLAAPTVTPVIAWPPQGPSVSGLYRVRSMEVCQRRPALVGSSAYGARPPVWVPRSVICLASEQSSY